MQSKEVHILSTKHLGEPLSYVAGRLTVFIDSSPFIRIEPVNDNDVKEAVLHFSGLSSTIIFTSRNAAEAVITYLNGYQPEWKIYCIGKATTEMITRNFTNSSIAGTANNAGALAEVIINNQVQSAVFFCGDHRREELPGMLNQKGIFLNEIIVYKTILMSHAVKKDYDAILFFSPSAVESFFLQNTVRDGCTLFAIGDTTAECIRRHSFNRISICRVPQKEALIKQAITYFTKIKSENGYDQE